MEDLVEIAPIPPVPLHDCLTYEVPAPLRAAARPGVRVRIPLGHHTRTGVVVRIAHAVPPGRLRSLLDVLDPEPFVPADLLDLCAWTARYYLVSLAEVLAAIVPVTL